MFDTPKKTFKATALALVAAASGLAVAPALADNHAAMAPASGNIVETAKTTGQHTTLVAAVEAAGIGDMLSAPGPYTIFAPTDAAFAKLPAGTVERLVQPENRQTLVSILSYHAVPGKVTSTDLVKRIKDNGGKTTLSTVAGTALTAELQGDKVVITDAKGGKATVTKADVNSTNGVIHVTDGVFLPA